jgi:hypothetical protein
MPHINEEISLRNILTCSQSNELRSLGALACTIRRKGEDRVQKVVLMLGGGEELDCTYDRWATDTLDEIRTWVNILNSIVNL